MRRQHSSAARVSTRKRRCSSGSAVYSVGARVQGVGFDQVNRRRRPGQARAPDVHAVLVAADAHGQALQGFDPRGVEPVALDLRVERHEQPHVVAAGASAGGDRALATSASPPLLASGTTSEAMAQIDSFIGAGILAMRSSCHW